MSEGRSANEGGLAGRAIIAAAPALADEPLRALVIDDDEVLRSALARVLKSRGFLVSTAADGVEALTMVGPSRFDVALVDLRMPRMGGLEFLRRVKEASLPIEVVMMTAFADVDVAVAALKAGAHHFLTKPFDSNEAIVLAVTKAAEHKRLLERANQLDEKRPTQEKFGDLVGTSARMEAVYRLIDGVAATRSTVLLLGESGTGKELVARAIHQRSQRAEAPFVTVNCAAIPRDLVESELFGHVRGAFTGAQASRAGLFEAANGGTVLLDEVGDLPLAAQVKLLRVLQDGEVKRVGSDETKIVDVRVIAATNVDLNSKIAAGTFRVDLFYRLNVIAISLPPLRDRADDIVHLTGHFLQKLARRMQRDPKRVTAEAMRALREYSWPGNVRELEHALEHAFVLSPSEAINPQDLPFIRAANEDPSRSTRMREEPASGSVQIAVQVADFPYAEAKRRCIETFDEAYTVEVLRRAEGNVSEAARQAGLDRSNFRRIVRRRREKTA